MVLTRQSDRKDRSIFCATSRALLLNSCHSVASEHHLRALSGVTAYKKGKSIPTDCIYECNQPWQTPELGWMKWIPSYHMYLKTKHHGFGALH